jgi:DNA-binding transcriptional regulator GbsR (MarR family)
MKKSTGISLASVASVVSIVGGLYLMDVFDFYVKAATYVQDESTQNSRIDDLELKDVVRELSPLKREYRDLKRYLKNNSDDEMALDERDDILDELIPLLEEKCAIKERLGSTCLKGELELLIGDE